MALLDRLRQELDRAGRSAQRAIDEGRLRLDLYRARQSVDRFAQRLGYAVYHARKAGGELSADDYTAHMNSSPKPRATGESCSSRPSRPHRPGRSRQGHSQTAAALTTIVTARAL